MQRPLLALLILAGLLSPVRAVVIDNAGTFTYQTTAPTNTNVPGWNAGWGESGITGWDYVGQIGSTSGASAVYLGNGWVITAGHVGTGSFVLDGTTYSLVAGSEQSITNGIGTADLTLFQISTAPALPELTVTVSAPSVGSSVVMTGYGGGQGETWGENAVTQDNIEVQVNGYSYKTIDFSTDYTGTNTTQLVGGDSGGGDFAFNSSSSQWELTGINEAIDGSNNSYMVELGAYASQIDTIVAVPEPRFWTQIILFGLLALGAMRKIVKGRRTS